MKNDFYIGIYEDRYLAHFGIPGMQWGVQNGPPYPLDSKKHDKVVKKGQSKKKNIVEEFKGKRKAKKTAKKRKAALEKARKVRAAKAAQAKKQKAMEADKERVLKSGSAKEIAKYQGQLTNKELQDAWNRLQLEANIISKAQAEGLKPDKVDDFFKKLEKATKYAKAGIDAYDTFADIYNAFGHPKKPIQKIKSGKKDKKKDDDD